MKKVLYILFFLFINISLLFAQENKKRTYEISVISQPQKVELIEYENGKYVGNVITVITQGKWKTGWLIRTWRDIWNIEDEEIVDKNQIDKKVVKNLMNELKKNEIETIKKCSKDQECNKYGFLDGGEVSFKIESTQIEREYGFVEIYPLKENNKEKIELRIKAQNLITIVYKHINLEQKFSELFKRLPRGYYNWYQASGHSIVTIKNRKRKNKYVW
ncbi:hypothetical protein [uncultured Polaribacter sp.]|uniref:hypothetical protein n=1 Tax=uncultured Polaribacter sp. TaxID=174711 RepID=UPI002602F793|nr:hypothetical protein [uncultured Polaribacter sp.]